MAPNSELTGVAPKVAAEIESWLRHLGDERRMSPKTVEAYRRDVVQFLGFLAAHRGGAPSLKELAALEPADVRAYMAARRAEGIGGRSLMRMLAGVRGFGRFLERTGKGKVGALAAVRTPKIAKTLPRPLSIGAAKQHGRPRSRRRRRAAAMDSRPRRRRARSALRRRAAHFRGARPQAQRFCRRHAGGDHGHRQGPQGAHGAGAAAGATTRRRLSRALPARGCRRRSVVRRRQRRPAVAADRSARHGAAARRARPARDGDAARAAPLLRHPPSRPAAATCARSRSCSATPRWRRHRSTPKSTPSG